MRFQLPLDEDTNLAANERDGLARHPALSTGWG